VGRNFDVFSKAESHNHKVKICPRSFYVVVYISIRIIIINPLGFSGNRIF